MVVGVTGPALADPYSVRTEHHVPVGISDRYSFEELMLFFAQPHEPEAGVFATPPLGLAVRTRAYGFIAPRTSAPDATWEVLGMPAMDLPLADLPGGKSLTSFLRSSTGEEPSTCDSWARRFGARTDR